MNDSRAASIFPDDLETLEAAGELLFRYHENTAGIRLLAIALRLRGQTGLGAELTERETRGDDPGLGFGSEWPPRPRSVSFELRKGGVLKDSGCFDIDESAGMAEVSNIRVVPRPVEDVEPPAMGGMPAPVTELRGYSRKVPPMGCGA